MKNDKEAIRGLGLYLRFCGREVSGARCDIEACGGAGTVVK